MQPDVKKLLRFLQSWVINTLAVFAAVYIVPGIHLDKNSSWLVPFIASLVLGILNAFIRPILMFLALPLLIFTPRPVHPRDQRLITLFCWFFTGAGF